MPRPDDDGTWLKLYQAYQFVRERCVMAAMKEDGTLLVQLHDMDKNQCLWKHEIKLLEPPKPDPNNPDAMYHQLPRLEWDSLCMSYDVAAIGKSLNTMLYS